MDSSISPKDEIWFLCVCHHISTSLYLLTSRHSRQPAHPAIPLRELEISQKHTSLGGDSEIGFWLPLGQKLMGNLCVYRKWHGEEWRRKRQTVSVRVGTTLGFEFVTCYLFGGSTGLSKLSARYQQWVPTVRLFTPHYYTFITPQARVSRFQNFTCKGPYVCARFKLRNTLGSCHMLPYKCTFQALSEFASLCDWKVYPPPPPFHMYGESWN